MLVPASIAIVLLRVQIVRLVLGSGHFGWGETVLTSQTLGFFALSLVFSGLIPLFSKAFYAVKNTKTPAIYAIITMLVTVGIAMVTSKYFGVAGLALAFSAGSLLNCSLLYYSLAKKIPSIDDPHIWTNLTKIIISSLVMAIAIQITKIAIGTIYDLDRFVEVAAQLIISLGIGAAVYFSITFLLGFRQIDFSKLENLISNLVGGLNGKKNQ